MYDLVPLIIQYWLGPAQRQSTGVWLLPQPRFIGSSLLTELGVHHTSPVNYCDNMSIALLLSLIISSFMLLIPSISSSIYILS